MERQYRLITALAVILLALVAIVRFGKEPAKDAGSSPHEPPDRELFDVENDAITSLTLKSASGDLVFARTEGTWAMTAPKAAPVEERKVSDIVERVTGLEVQDRDLSGARADYGLDEAQRVEIVLGKADATTLSVFVGKDSPVGYRTYVSETADGPVLLASSRINELAHRTADDFRSHALWKLSSGTARRIRIEAGAESVVLRKDDHGWWLGDEGPRASETAVTDWLSSAGGLRAESFLDDADPIAVGLATPSATLTVEDTTGVHTLKLGQRDPAGAVAQGAEGPVRVGSDAVELVRLDGWTETKLLPVRRAQVDTIEIKLGDRTARYTKQEDAWADASGKAVTSVESLFDALDDATADRTATGVEPPAAVFGRIALSEGTTRVESVTIGAASAGGDRAAKDDAGGPPFRVPQSSLDAIAAALAP